MNARSKTIPILAAALLAGCVNANDLRPIVDQQGVNPEQYRHDLLVCQAYANDVNPQAKAIAGALAGAALGAGFGAIGGAWTGNAGYGAAVGASLGAPAGALGAGGGAVGEMKSILARCLAGRGYSVLSVQ